MLRELNGNIPAKNANYTHPHFCLYLVSVNKNVIHL